MLFVYRQLRDHEMEEYKYKLQEYWRGSKPDLTICMS